MSFSFEHPHAHQLSLQEIITSFYPKNDTSNEWTCYTHLKCDRGSTLSCLDWSEICDGYVDCLNDGVDEQHCWMLEINECDENEHRCYNGQCIPNIFAHDAEEEFECLDRSDGFIMRYVLESSGLGKPTFTFEDSTRSRFLASMLVKSTSSIVEKRDLLLKSNLLIDTPHSMTTDCWTALRCRLNIVADAKAKVCSQCLNPCADIIRHHCPELLVVPATPLLYSHVFILYERNQIFNYVDRIRPQYICYNDQLCGGFYSNRSLLKISNLTCRPVEDFSISQFPNLKSPWLQSYINILSEKMHHCNTIVYNNVSICNKPTMYQCKNSHKCISIYRLCDEKYDCDEKEDEDCPIINEPCTSVKPVKLFLCPKKQICIAMTIVNDGFCQCPLEDGLCEDEFSDGNVLRNEFHLQRFVMDLLKCHL